MGEIKFRKYNRTLLEDNNFFKEIYSDENHITYFGNESLNIIKETDNSIYGNVYIFFNSNNERIGYVEISDCIYRDGLNSVTLYYAVLPKFRGHKYGSKMINVITEYLFNNTDVNNIIMNIDSENKASIKSVQLAGYNDFIDYDDEIQFHKKR